MYKLERINYKKNMKEKKKREARTTRTKGKGKGKLTCIYMLWREERGGTGTENKIERVKSITYDDFAF